MKKLNKELVVNIMKVITVIAGAYIAGDLAGKALGETIVKVIENKDEA